MVVHLFSNDSDFCKVHHKIINVSKVKFYDGLIEIFITDDNSYTYSCSQWNDIKIL